MPYQSPPPPGPGRPKDPAKRKAILMAAKTLFIQKGYGASSMEAIAATAGVSKLTVYSHFTDKETLFAAAVTAKCEEQLPPVLFHFNADSPIRTTLLNIGRGFFSLINSEESLALQRLMLSQASHNPQLSQLYYNAGPRQLCDAMEQFLQDAHASRQLHIDNPKAAAEHFISMIKGGHNMRLLAGIEPPMDEASAELHVQGVVDLFMRAFALNDSDSQDSV